MAKYQRESIQEVLNLYKQDIVNALDGVEVDHNTNAKRPVTQQDARRSVVETFDDTSYYLLSYLATSKALVHILHDNGIDLKDHMEEYVKYYEEEKAKQNVYKRGFP